MSIDPSQLPVQSLAYVESLYYDYLDNPSSVPEHWQKIFSAMGPNGLAGKRPPESFDRSIFNGYANGNGNGNGAEKTTSERIRQDNVRRLIHAFRNMGHLYAHLNPLEDPKPLEESIVLADFGLTEADLNTAVPSFDVGGPDVHTLRELLDRLRNTYCRTIGVDINHIHNPQIRNWLHKRIESTFNKPTLNHAEHRRILEKLTQSVLFEQFLHTKFVGAKRFSLEGGESLIPLLDMMIKRASEDGAREVVIGMAHRGRLNVLVNITGKPAADVFSEFLDMANEDDTHDEDDFTGDVKYHLGYSSDLMLPNGESIHLSLCFNPSHLEFVNTVVQGRVRAKQTRIHDFGRSRVVPILIHGDAAYAGEGIIMEMLNMSQLEGYKVGGTIHVVVNNQVGFTTSPGDARSTTYSTDITKMLQVPIFHVNGEDPEAVAQVVQLAVDFRKEFSRDVVIELWGYRKYGHNEGDEPSFTQPLMYQKIAKKPTMQQVYAKHLEKIGSVSAEEAEAIAQKHRDYLGGELERVKRDKLHSKINTLGGLWVNYKGGKDADVPDVPTSVSQELLQELGEKICNYPGVTIHPTVQKILETRREMAQGKKDLDWGMGEALAFASLLNEGRHVRLSGQDARRGTFSHRHSVVRDQVTGEQHSSLKQLRDKQGVFEVYDSPLCEAGVLGFDYGYSLDFPDALVIWEAQFGDFANTAQVIIDQFIVSSEVKWQRLSNLVMLLPHGMEGMGPEHSSARLGRFLNLCAADNIQVLNLTTPAQIFHALRRQVLRSWRKPMVVMSPKSLLRHKDAVSPLKELTEGQFQPVIPDQSDLARKKAKRIVLCSGKVYYDLAAVRDKENLPVAILRLEQLYPLREKELMEAFEGYTKGTPLIWTQEEQLNMGAKDFIRDHLPQALRIGHPLHCVGRIPSPSPATGSPKRHAREQKEIVEEALKGELCPLN